MPCHRLQPRQDGDGAALRGRELDLAHEKHAAEHDEVARSSGTVVDDGLVGEVQLRNGNKVDWKRLPRGTSAPTSRSDGLLGRECKVQTPEPFLAERYYPILTEVMRQREEAEEWRT